MSSDSGMTPEKAAGIVENYETVDFSVYNKDECDFAKGFLLGVAYQEEKAKGLVEALEAIKRQTQSADAGPYELGNINHIVTVTLAHYRQGQEKP